MPDKVYILILNWTMFSRQNFEHINQIINNSKYKIILLSNEPDYYEKSSLIFYRLTQNLGYSKANNIGIRKALEEGAEYVFILNPDTEINKDTVPNLLKVFKKYPDTGICGPKILTPDGKIWGAGGIINNVRYSGGLRSSGEKDSGQYGRIEDADYVPGTAMMVKRTVFEKIGLLPEDYFLYYEDTDFCLKAKKAGFKLKYAPGSTIIHFESSYAGKNSPFQRYYMTRNRLYFMEKYAPVEKKMREIIRFPKTIFEHIKRRDKYSLLGIRDYILRRKGKCDYWS